VIFYFIFFKDDLFDTERAQAGGAAEGEGEAGSLLSREPDAGLGSEDPGIMT